MLSQPLLDADEAAAAVRRAPFFRPAAFLVGAILLFTLAVALFISLALPPPMATLGILAYCFGCRHGIDADHIAAIDNVTRRLVASGQRSMTVGCFFSLGHCAVVFMLCGVVMLSADATSVQLEEWEEAGSAVGPWVAAAVLLGIGSLNLCVARDLYSQFRMRQARGHEHEIASLVGRCCPSFLAAIDRPWKVCWIGLLFGLGLDTATEIGLLTISALSQPVPAVTALVLPTLFAAGMSLVDSLNGILMLYAYEWAADHGPMYRLYFSLFLTTSSAVLAVFVGALLALGQLATQLPLPLRGGASLAGFWRGALWLNDHIEVLGAITVGCFLAAITCAIALAPMCAPSASEIERDEKAKNARSLVDYINKGEFIVRVE